MKNKRIICITTIVALLLFVIVSKISIFEKNKAPFSDSQLYDLLKQYQEKADASNIEDEAEISQLDMPVDFNFSVDFYHINGNDYMMISGMRGYSFILRDRIELKSNEFMGFASYDDYHIAFFNNSCSNFNKVQEIMKNVSFENFFYHLEKRDDLYFYDPYYVVYKLQESGNPLFVEEGCDIQILK